MFHDASVLRSITSRVRGSIYVPILSFMLLVPSVTLMTTKWYFLAPAPAIGLLLGIMLWHRPLWGLNLVIFLIPLEQFRTLNEKLAWLTLSKLVGAFLVIVVLARWFFLRESPALRSRLWPCLGMFMLTAMLATLYTVSPMTAANELRQMITAVLFFALTLSLVSYQGLLRSVSLPLLLGVTLSALLALFGYITANPLFIVTTGENLVRAVGGSNDPNLFSIPLILTLPLLAFYFFEAKRLRWRIAALLLAMINCSAVVVSFSRGAALVMSVIFVLILIQHRKYFDPHKLGLLFSGLLAVGVMILALVPSSYWERQLSLVTKSDESLSRRMDYIYVGFNLFMQAPLIGHGPGVFQDLWAEKVSAGEVDPGSAGGISRMAHNTYLEMIVGLGTLGLTSYLCFIYIALRNFNQSQRQLILMGRSRDAAMVAAYKIGFITILIYFMIISAYTNKFFWLYLAFSQITLNASRQSSGEQE